MVCLPASSEGLGDDSILSDFGISLKAHNMDAEAAMALGPRHARGRFEAHSYFFWVQERIANGDIDVREKHTSENLADMLTRTIGESSLRKLMLQVRFEFLSRKASLACNI